MVMMMMGPLVAVVVAAVALPASLLNKGAYGTVLGTTHDDCDDEEEEKTEESKKSNWLHLASTAAAATGMRLVLCSINETIERTTPK